MRDDLIDPKKLKLGFMDDWERVLLEVIPELERNLINAAKGWQQEALIDLDEYRKMDDGPPPINLGIVVRVREDMLGPRIHWVRFRGKARYAVGGAKFTPTEPIRMQGRYRYSARIFAPFPETVRKDLLFVENEFARIRFRTERLAALRDFCRKTASTKY